MTNSCCDSYLNTNEPYCPICGSQLAEHRAELARAREFHVRWNQVGRQTQQLVERGLLPAEEVGFGTRFVRSIAARNPARRAVFKLLGVYMPETEAKDVLARIHEHKWIQAEKAGYDIWDTRSSRSPLGAAARDWAGRYLERYQNWRERHRMPGHPDTC